MTIQEIRARIAAGDDSEHCIHMLDIYITQHPDDDEAFYLRGVRYWSMGKRSLAINDYLTAIRLNPESKATMAIKTSYEILNYYNKDLYNP